MSIRLTIISQIQQVATEQKKTLAPLSDDLPLLESASIRCALRSWWRASRI